MSSGVRRVAAAVASCALALLVCGLAAATPSYGVVPHAKTQAAALTQQRDLDVTFTGVSPVLRLDRRMHLSGILRNPSRATWYSVQVYLQMSYGPATTSEQLQTYAGTGDDPAFGNVFYRSGLVRLVGDVKPGQRASFRFDVPFNDLEINKQAGVYRVGVEVLASSAPGGSVKEAGTGSTLVPLMPFRDRSLLPAQTLTLLPVTAPVKRLDGGAFADDSLAKSLSFGGRLSNLMSWAVAAPPNTLQVVVDPALLTAIADMSDGYRVAGPHAVGDGVEGAGKTAAITWLINFNSLVRSQHVMLLPWGVPAANSLIAQGVPGPVAASVRASVHYLGDHQYATGVAGWLTDGKTGVGALQVMRSAGADLPIVAQSSLPALQPQDGTPPPSLVDLHVGPRLVPTLVTTTDLAGQPVTVRTTALQFRQELIADAAVRAIRAETTSITVVSLPFRWDPGPGLDQGLASAFRLPFLAAQSAIGTADQLPSPYAGLVRPGPGEPTLGPHMIDAVRQLRRSGGALASILRPAKPAQAGFDQVYAMAGSHLWHTYPRLGVRLVLDHAAAARKQLTKVTVTGPPFVAMSSQSGRFPLTVTNGLGQAVSVRLDVLSADPALHVSAPGVLHLDSGERSDVTVQTTAEGSGVTSVRAQLATPQDARFGKSWRFDIRATQIGLVIWIVMGVGGAILFGAAGYRIVNRLRGRRPSRPSPRRAAT